MLDFNESWNQGQAMGAAHTSLPENWLDEFKATMSQNGITPPDFISETDGFDRFPIGNKKGKSGFCNFVNMGTYAYGTAGDWATGVRVRWSSHSKETTDPKTWEIIRRKIEADQARAEKEKKKGQEKIAKDAQRVFDAAKPVTIEHPYLKRKLGMFAGLEIHGLNVDCRENLMIPMKDINGVIHNIEYVTPKEPKDIWRHHIKGEKGISGRSDGLFFGINGTNDCFLCEGLSTGLTIHYATGATVICAFNAGNLPKVAAEFKVAHPSYNYKVCADNDLWRDDGKNPGAEGGQEAAKILGCECIFPKFKDTATKPTDFNDLGVLEGVGPVREQVHSPGENFLAKSPSQTSFKNNCRKRPPDREYLLTYKGAGFLPKGIVGLLAATGGTGKTFFLLTLANTLACGGKLGPIEAVQPFKVLIVCGEDDQDELYRRMWDICHGVFPDNLYGVSTVGEVGPLMKMDGKNPVRADGFRWLENTIQLHEDIDILFLDPKSRFYGLEENNNDHGTQWVQCLEYLSKKYGITILFTSHTSEQNAGKISQVMNRGASAIVDGCRWAAGMCQMSKEIADKYSIANPKEYVVLDLPKSNYTALLRTPLYFKREVNGVLKYSDLGRERFEEMGGFLLELIRNDANQYTKNELVRMPVGNGIAQDMKENFPSFVRSKDMVCVIDHLVKVKSLQAILINPGRNSKEVLVPGEVK